MALWLPPPVPAGTPLGQFCAREGVVVANGSYLFPFTSDNSIFILLPRLEKNHEGHVYLKIYFKKKTRLSLSSKPPPTSPLTHFRGGDERILNSASICCFSDFHQSETVKSYFVSSSELSTYWIRAYYQGEEHFLHIKCGSNCFLCPRMTRIGYFLHALIMWLAANSKDGHKSRTKCNKMDTNARF